MQTSLFFQTSGIFRKEASWLTETFTFQRADLQFSELSSNLCLFFVIFWVDEPGTFIPILLFRRTKVTCTKKNNWLQENGESTKQKRIYFWIKHSTSGQSIETEGFFPLSPLASTFYHLMSWIGLMCNWYWRKAHGWKYEKLYHPKQMK
jgi:hypothetical protein